MGFPKHKHTISCCSYTNIKHFLHFSFEFIHFISHVINIIILFSCFFLHFFFFLLSTKKCRIHFSLNLFFTLSIWQKHGQRMKCAACKVVAHASCISIIMERPQMACKPTFRDVGVRQYREQTTTHHHWAHRRSEKGKCNKCGRVYIHSILFYTYLLLRMKIINKSEKRRKRNTTNTKKTIIIQLN